MARKYSRTTNSRTFLTTCPLGMRIETYSIRRRRSVAVVSARSTVAACIASATETFHASKAGSFIAGNLPDHGKLNRLPNRFIDQSERHGENLEPGGRVQRKMRFDLS